MKLDDVEITLLYSSVTTYIDETRNEIATCPDAELYKSDIARLEYRLEHLVQLKAKLEKELLKCAKKNLSTS